MNYGNPYQSQTIIELDATDSISTACKVIKSLQWAFPDRKIILTGKQLITNNTISLPNNVRLIGSN